MQVGDLSRTSKGRFFINTVLLPRLASRLKEGSRVLFVGTDTNWDYKSLFFNPSILTNFETMDIKESLKPDIVGDISNCPQIADNTYDFVILIGVYEFVNDKPAMFREIHRILKPDGFALLSLPGRGYYESQNNHVEPWEVWEKIKPLKVKELYVIEDTPTKPPSSVHVVAIREDAVC